jgi:hypothetical protein
MSYDYLKTYAETQRTKLIEDRARIAISSLNGNISKKDLEFLVSSKNDIEMYSSVIDNANHRSVNLEKLYKLMKLEYNVPKQSTQFLQLDQMNKVLAIENLVKVKTSNEPIYIGSTMTPHQHEIYSLAKRISGSNEIAQQIENYVPPNEYITPMHRKNPSLLVKLKNETFSSDAFTSTYSPKITNLLSKLTQSTGPVIIYSQYDQGIGSLSTVMQYLKTNGMTEYEPITGSNVNSDLFNIFDGYVQSERDIINKTLQIRDQVFASSDLLMVGPEPGIKTDPNPSDIKSPIAYRQDKKSEGMAYTYSHLHLGQRKLFLTELYLLTQYIPVNVPITLVYAGAASGEHFPFLAELFPSVTFHLYDPAQFHIDPKKLKLENRIYLYTQLFEDETAKEWGPDGLQRKKWGEPHFFISDIRFTLEGKTTVETEKQVSMDMDLQARWTRLIQPTIASMLKFRPPYVYLPGTSLKYLRGRILWQCWPPKLSTETRLIVEAEDCKKPDVEYPVTDYESVCYKHNIIDRPWKKYTDLSIKTIGYDGCWDCRAEAETWRLYIVNKSTNTIDIDIENEISKYMTRLSKEIGKPLIKQPSLHGTIKGDWVQGFAKAVKSKKVHTMKGGAISGKYVNITNLTKDQLDILVQQWNDKNNIKGNVVKCLLTSSPTAMDLQLKYIKQVHILDGYKKDLFKFNINNNDLLPHNRGVDTFIYTIDTLQGDRVLKPSKLQPLKISKAPIRKNSDNEPPVLGKANAPKIESQIPIRFVEYEGLNVIDESILLLGTKERAKGVALPPLGGKIGYLYTGSFSGTGPAIAAVMANMASIPCKVILDRHPVGSSTPVTSEEVKLSKTYQVCVESGAEVEIVKDWSEINKRGKELSEDYLWLPLGLDYPEMEIYLAEALKEAGLLKEFNALASKPTLWVVGGVGLIAASIARAVPNLQIKVVPASSVRVAKLKERLKDYKNCTVIDPNPDFSKIVPPYNSVLGYDSIVWGHALKQGKKDDWVWNTASQLNVPVAPIKVKEPKVVVVPKVPVKVKVPPVVKTTTENESYKLRSEMFKHIQQSGKPITHLVGISLVDEFAEIVSNELLDTAMVIEWLIKIHGLPRESSKEPRNKTQLKSYINDAQIASNDIAKPYISTIKQRLETDELLKVRSPHILLYGQLYTHVRDKTKSKSKVRIPKPL